MNFNSTYQDFLINASDIIQELRNNYNLTDVTNAKECEEMEDNISYILGEQNSEIRSDNRDGVCTNIINDEVENIIEE